MKLGECFNWPTVAEMDSNYASACFVFFNTIFAAVMGKIKAVN
jgi:hypothetical protein